MIYFTYEITSNDTAELTIQSSDKKIFINLFESGEVWTSDLLQLSKGRLNVDDVLSSMLFDYINARLQDIIIDGNAIDFSESTEFQDILFLQIALNNKDKIDFEFISY